MGLSCSWLAVKEGNEAQALGLLGMKPSGNEMSLANGVAIGWPLQGWYVVFQFGNDELVDAELLARVSADATVVAGMCEEHVMWGTLEQWTKGQRDWAVQHIPEKKVMHLATEGEVPAAYAAIAERLMTEQMAAGGEKAEVDHLIEIPAELARVIVGVDLNEEPPDTATDLTPTTLLQRHARLRRIGAPLTTSAPAPAPQPGERKGFFSRLFGG